MIKGISQNTHPEGTAPDYIYWAKNAVLNRKLDAAINEQGNRIVHDLLPFNFKYKVGVVVLGVYIILFYKNTSDEDCIATVNEFTGQILVRVQRTDFNFQEFYPITGKAKFNSNNELVVAFVDGYNTSKYVNLDTAEPTDSLNFYNLFPIVYSASNITGEVIEGGSVTNGAYIFTFQYITKDRTRSTFTTLSNPIYVSNIDTNEPFIKTKGNKSNTASNKAIKLTIADLDESYSKIAIAVIAKLDGVVTQKIIKELPITSGTMSFLYSGLEFDSDITLDELITDNIRYISAKHITTINDQLFLGDLRTNPVIDYQTIANQTVIQWISSLDTADTLAASSKYKEGNKKTFIHEEVYALYQQFELVDGTFSDWFHIPGRAVTVGEQADSALTMGGLQVEGRNPKIYEVQDTCTSNGPLGAPSGGIYKYSGVMSAWQNNNETYPNTERWVVRDNDDNIILDLRNQKVRHHKFPSIEFLADNVYNAQAGYGINVLDRLDIKIINNAVFANPNIRGYRVGYAKRSLADASVLGMGLTIFAASPSTNDGISEDTNTLMSAAGNFDVVCSNGNPDDIRLNKSHIRFNSFDIWQDRPALTGTYLRNYIKLTANKLASSAVGYNNAGNTYGMIHPGSGSFDMVAYSCNFTVQGADNVVRGSVTSNDKVRKLSNTFYLPNNVKLYQDSLVINNLGLEETVLAKVEGATLALGAIGQLRTDSGTSIDDPAMGEETYIAAIKKPKSDFFVGYENQPIVVNPVIFRSTSAETTLVDKAINGNFDGGLTSWSQVGAGPAWTDGGGFATTSLVAPTTESAILYQSGYTPETLYTISFNLTKTISTTPFLVWLDSSNNVLSVVGIGTIGVINISSYSPVGGVRLGFKLQNSLDPGTVTIDNLQAFESVLTSSNQLYEAGDGFVGVHSYVALSSYNKNVDPTVTETERVVNFHIHLGVGRHNPGLRYQTVGVYSSYFYPDGGIFTIDSSATDKYWFYNYSRQSEWNKFLYSKDYSTVNDYETFGVYVEGAEVTEDYRFRIARSTKASRENSLEDGWKTFRLIDYFDTVRNKGEITNLEAWGNEALIIHHRNALFRTRDKAVLQTNLLSVTLGSGDIFEIEPREERPTNVGTGGTQHKFSCILTEFGYFFMDAETGTPFLYDGNQLAPIGKGLKNFFKQFVVVTGDNPFTISSSSITSAYDHANDRIFLSQKGGYDFTVSFDLVKQEWVSAHDFLPSYMFNTRKHFYSFSGNQLYTHNDPYAFKGRYYNVTYPFFVDFIVNDGKDVQKVLEAISWLAKVYELDGSVLQRKPISSVTIWNDQHCSGQINLVTNETASLFVDANVKIVDEQWHFDEIKDQVIDPSLRFVEAITADTRPILSNLAPPAWYDAEPLRGKYFIVRLEYSNTENKEVHLRELFASLRKSKS